MRSLSSSLLAAQKAQAKLGPPTPKLWKVILSRSGEVTKGYDKSRIISCNQVFSPSSQKAEIILKNSDKALVPAGVPIDFENYQAVISYGFDTNVTRTAWVTTTAYVLDDIRRPVTANGYQYRCAIAGTSHAATEPTWPTGLGVRVTDGTVTWEMDGNSGDEYSYDPPMKVRVQEYHSGRGLLRCILRCIGIPDQLKEDKALVEYTQTSDDTNTVKTLIDLVCAAGTGLSSTYGGYTAITVVYDTATPYDGILDTFCPKDYFSINAGESRWDKLEELLAYTKCKARIDNDGKLHIFVPRAIGKTWVLNTAYIVNDYVQPSTPNNNWTYQCTTAGTSGGTQPTWPTTEGGTVTDGDVVWTARGFHYEYKYKVSGDHTFFNKTVRLRFVEPNEEIVHSHIDHSPQYTGTAYSATSYALDPKIHVTRKRLASNAQALAIAKAIIESYELDAEVGFATVPMNVGQELWDYVKVTDSRQGDTKIGNIQYLSKNVKKPEGREGLTFSMALGFGKVSMQSIMANLVSSGVGEGEVAAEVVARLSNEQIYALFDSIADYLKNLSYAEWLKEKKWVAIDATTSVKGIASFSSSDFSVSSGVVSILAASDTVSGQIEIATIAETNTGTDATRAVSPDGLAGSNLGTKAIGVIAVDATTDLTQADGKAYIPVPACLNGMNLTRAQAIVNTAGTTNATTIDIYNVTDSQDMLSGAISIASGATVGTVGTINATYDDVATNDVLRVDVTTMSTTAPKGLLVVLEFQLP